MTTQPPRGHAKLAVAIVIAAVIIVIIITSTVIIPAWTSSGTKSANSASSSSSGSTTTSSQGTLSGSGTQTQTSSTISSSSSSSPQPSYPNGQTYLNVSAIYSGLGYPQLTYSSYSQYLPSKPNYTMEYQTQNVSFQVGSIGADVINLDQAVGLAAQKAGLNPSNYSLAEADFEPGTIVNSSLAMHPEWLLFFARVYDGYWLFGCCGNSASSVEVNMDALNGTVLTPTFDLSNLPTSGHYELKMNSSQALLAVRASKIPGIPAALTENGAASFMEPRIVLLGPSSNNEAFQNPLNASLSGEKRLCWIIDLYSPTPEYGYQGTFAVDTETGELVSGWAQALYPNTQFESVMGSVNYSSASNLIVSHEAFQIDGGVVGSSGSLPVTVPNVVVVKPGSTASIELNFSSTVPENISAALSFANPLPGIESLSQSGVPQGVSFESEPPTLVISPIGGSTSAQLLISVDKNAPSGTYLIEVNASLYDPHGAPQGASEVLFFLSVWDGAGQWPMPPIIK